MEDLEALQGTRKTKVAIERSEEEVIPWKQAMQEIREDKVTGD